MIDHIPDIIRRLSTKCKQNRTDFYKLPKYGRISHRSSTTGKSWGNIRSSK
jgi:hypothetical protein